MEALGHIAGSPADGYAPARPAVPVLREYQVRALDRARALASSGRRRIVIVAPTGAGKMVLAAEIIRSATSMGRRVVFLAHRRELVNQAVATLARFGVDAGVHMNTDRRRDDWLPTQVCSVSTLARRMDRLPPASVVLADECHHIASNTWRSIIAAYDNATVIGFTATPWRVDKQGLADIFDASVLVATPAELIAQGYLTPYQIFAYDAPDLHKVKITAGDYNAKQLDVACNTAVLVGSIVKEYVAHASHRPGIVFPVSIEHSKAIVAEFNNAGVTAAHLDCHMAMGERDAVLRGFADGSITVVGSCGVLTEGFDQPRAEVCMLARPTKSLGLYLQMLGRVLRPSPGTGKREALIHDHSGSVLRLGLPDEPRDYSLTATPSRERDLLTCPLCLAVFGAVTKEGRCPKCGEAIAPRVSKAAEDGEGRQIVMVEGERIDKAQIMKLRAERLGKGLEDVPNEHLLRASRATTDDKIAELKRLQNVAAEKGLKPGFAAHQYRRAFGVWPGNFEAADLGRVPAATKSFIPYKRSR